MENKNEKHDTSVNPVWVLFLLFMGIVILNIQYSYNYKSEVSEIEIESGSLLNLGVLTEINLDNTLKDSKIFLMICGNSYSKTIRLIDKKRLSLGGFNKSNNSIKSIEIAIEKEDGLYIVRRISNVELVNERLESVMEIKKEEIKVSRDSIEIFKWKFKTEIIN